MIKVDIQGFITDALDRNPALRRSMANPLPTDRKGPPKVYISPDLIANGQPAEDEPIEGYVGKDAIVVMKVPSVGFLVLRDHGNEAGVSIYTNAEVGYFDGL